MIHLKSSTIGFLILLFTFISCNEITSFGADDVPLDWENGESIIQADDSNLSSSLRDRLQHSAEVLAVEYILGEDSTRISIPDKMVELCYNGLVHVANSTYAEAKEVIYEKSINARPSFRLNEVLVFPDTTEAVELIKSWQKNEPLTGNSEVDALINEYGFSIDSFSELRSMPYAMVTMETDTLINVLPVAKKFEPINGITNAGANFIMGDGSTIQAEIKEDHLLLQFVYKWGDCPAGCINSSSWKFNIYKDGTVEVVK